MVSDTRPVRHKSGTKLYIYHLILHITNVLSVDFAIQSHGKIAIYYTKSLTSAPPRRREEKRFQHVNKIQKQGLESVVCDRRCQLWQTICTKRVPSPVFVIGFSVCSEDVGSLAPPAGHTLQFINRLHRHSHLSRRPELSDGHQPRERRAPRSWISETVRLEFQ